MEFPFSLPENKEFDVVGFGTNAVDFLIRVPEYPAFNSKIELTDYTQAAGGEVATAVAGLKRLGLETSYVGRFGSDAAGDFGMSSLRDEGVDLRYAEQIEGAGTQIAFIVIDERSGERTVIWKRDEKLWFTKAEAPVEAAAAGKILHFTPHDVKACLAMAKRANESGAIVSVDIDNLFEGVQELLSYVDIFIASADFPKKLFGPRDLREALREMRSLSGCAVVGVTLGEKGRCFCATICLLKHPDLPCPAAARTRPVRAMRFALGFCTAITGRSVEESAKMANAVAALKCRLVGARTALPDIKELNAVIGTC